MNCTYIGYPVSSNLQKMYVSVIHVFTENVTYTNMYIYMYIPASLMTSSTIAFVNFISILEPAAFGCTAAMSPDRPMP